MKCNKYCTVGNQGFTLIEILVAFSILSLTLSVLFAILSAGSRTTRISEEYSRAVVLAESKFDELGVTNPLYEGITRGSFNSTYHWELRVDKRLRRSESFIDEPEWHLLDVTLRVWWRSAELERDVVLKSIRIAARG